MKCKASEMWYPDLQIRQGNLLLLLVLLLCTRGSTASREKISDGKEEILEFSLLPELQKVMSLAQMHAYLFAWYLFQITYLQLSIGRHPEGPAMRAADKAIAAD